MALIFLKICQFYVTFILMIHIYNFGEVKPMAKSNSKDIVLIGAGVLSTTFGSMLKEIEPDWNIHVYERLDRPAIESSNERNNAGTGHAALCELNYTVLQPDGSIDIEKRK